MGISNQEIYIFNNVLRRLHVNMVKKFKRYVVAGLVASMMVTPAAGSVVRAEGNDEGVSDGVNPSTGDGVDKHTITDANDVNQETPDGTEEYENLENGDYEYKISDLEFDSASSASSGMSGLGVDVTTKDDGSAEFNFKDQYAQAYFKLPKGINPRRVSKVEFKVEDGNGFSVKVLPAPGDDSLQDKGGISYNPSLSISGFDFKYIAAMSLAEGGGKYNVSSVVFTLVDEPAVEVEVDGSVVTKKLSDLTLALNGGAEIDEETGKVTFTAQYQSLFFELPSDIDPVLLNQIEVKGDASTFNYKIMSQAQFADEEGERWGNGIKVSYGNAVLSGLNDPNAKYLIIMSGGGDADWGSFSLSSDVDFTVEASKEIQTDIPNLKDTVVSDDKGLGADSFVGTCIGSGSMKDEKLVALVKKHFNAVTLENELKPESMLGKSAPTATKEDPEFGLVPESLDFTVPDSMLDEILKWNTEDGVDIKVRGHVLTWHSQTPSWFFREGYSEDGDYVSPEVMTKRHEWYIKNVMEHYFSEDSKYKDLFYGFDVVNEACSDGSGTYRSAQENSPWAAIYGTGSEEDAPDYILNAFRFANKYAPQTLELYYNDYNDCQSSKVPAIENLLKSVKKHESDAELPTRISGFGMQAHHEMDSPTKQQIIDCAKKYGAIVGKVQVTELDVKTSKGYDGSKAAKEAEYTRMGHRYKDIFEAYREIDQDPGVDVNSFTVWGTIDSVSWLNDANNNGGGSNGSQKQCPLLFDGNYQAKPAFWGIVNPGELEPNINVVDIIETNDGSFDNGKTYSFAEGDLNVEFTPIWKNDSLKFGVKVSGATLAADDTITVYFEDAEGAIKKAEVKGSEFTDGSAVVEIAGSYAVLDTLKFDVVAKVGETKAAFNDLKFGQEDSSKYFASATFKPYASIKYGSATIDGDKDEIWSKVDSIPLTINLPSDSDHTVNAKAEAKLLWDDVNLYLYMDVEDSVLNKENSAAHEQDSVEVFIDENNAKAGGYESDDKQYRINFDNELSFNGTNCTEENVDSKVVLTDKGYAVEAAFKWTDVKVTPDSEIGLELQINDAGEDGKRAGTLSWFDTSGSGWSNPGVFGTARLSNDKADGSGKVIEDKKDDTKKDDVKQDDTKKDDTKKDDTKVVDTKITDTKKTPSNADTPTTEAQKVDTKVDDIKTIFKINKGADEASANKFITGVNTTENLKGSSYKPLAPVVKKTYNNKANIKWTKVSGAKKYVIYGGVVGKNSKFTKLGETTKTSFTAKNLQKGKEYAYVVIAYDKTGKVLNASQTVDAFTKGSKYTNVKSIKVSSKKKVVLKKGKKSTIKASVVSADKKLKLKDKKLKYVSSNKSVATVNSKGKITAKKKGKCVIYVYAKNGVSTKINVTVK